MNLIEIAKSKIKERKTIIITEGWDERVLKSVNELHDLMDFILIGDEDEIRNKAAELKVDLKDIKIFNPKKSEITEKLANDLYELRKHKGWTLEKAKELIEDEQYFGCMLLHNGYGDALGGSVICSTGALMRPVLQIIKTLPDVSLVSETLAMWDSKREKYFFMTDPSLNINPTPEELAQIAINGAEVVKSFDIEPKVALLSFSTKGSGGDSPLIEPIRKALSIIKEKMPDLKVDGELQVDAAIDKDAAKKKGAPELGGDANLLVFPNLTASNISIHALFKFSDLKFELPIIYGVKKPIAIFGRSVSKEVVKNDCIMLAMEANVS